MKLHFLEDIFSMPNNTNRPYLLTGPGLILERVRQ